MSTQQEHEQQELDPQKIDIRTLYGTSLGSTSFEADNDEEYKAEGIRDSAVRA